MDKYMFEQKQAMKQPVSAIYFYSVDSGWSCRLEQGQDYMPATTRIIFTPE